MIIPNIKAITQKRLGQLTKARNTADYRDWRVKVLMRDNHKCQYPGCTAVEKLEIHHIRRFAQNKHLRTATFNGITLCEKHHDMISQHEEYYEVMFFKIVQANEKIHKNKVEEIKNAAKKDEQTKDKNNSGQ
jgi:5-methylcytosine-specific restriction endonuclease McrA